MTRQRVAFTLLLLYWPAIFILTHIFLPQSILTQMRASDKALHFLVYFILIILLWFSISPAKKANIKSKKVWFILLLLVIYAAIDEWLQGLCAGRTRDFMDFVSNVEGIGAGFVLICLFPFRPAVLLATGAAILVFTSAVRIQFTGPLAFIRPLFLFSSFGFFTFIWCEFLTFYQPVNQSRLKWVIASGALPFALIAAVKILAKFTGRAFELEDFILSSLAILTVIAITYFIKKQFRNPKS